jgi:beta-glucosidase
LRYLDTPAVGNFPGEQGQVRYGEGLLVGYRWYDARQLPVAFPFGHGLTYTTFDYSALSVEVADAAAARVDVGLTVTNTGPRPGTETVQLYVADPVATVMRPTQELKAFGRVDLAPGESRRMRFALDSRAFAWWSPRDGRWVVEGGRFELRVGASSRDIRLRAEIELPGDAAAPALTAKSPLGEWLAHPAGGPLLRQLFDASGSAGLLGNPELMTLMSGNPLDRLCRFPGVGVTDDALAALVERAQAAAT